MNIEAKSFFTLRDFAYIFRKNRKNIFRWSLACFFLSCGILFMKSPKYLVEGVFQFNTPVQSEPSSVLEILKRSASSATSKDDIQVILRSKKFSFPMIQKEGLQVQYHKKEGFFSKVFRKFHEGWNGFMGYKIPDQDRFIFLNVSYDKESPLNFSIQFMTENQFEISLSKDQVFIGKLKEPVEFLEGKLTLYKKPKTLTVNQKYYFTIQPMETAHQEWKNLFSISNEISQKKFLKISCLHRDRHFATHLINEILFDFQKYLKKESESIAKDHLQFLHNRQEIVSQNFVETLQSNVRQFEDNLRDSGFLYFKDEIHHLLKERGLYTSRLQSIELSLKRLKNSFPQKKELLPDGYRFTADLSKKICDLKKQKNDLELVLYEKRGNFDQDFLFKKPRQDLKKEILKVKANQEKIKEILHQLHETESIPNSLQGTYPEIFENLNFSLFTKEDQIEYFKDIYHELELKEKYIHNQQNDMEDFSKSYEGILFSSAQKLYLSTQDDIEKSMALIKLYEHYFQQLDQPQFEWSSLSAIPNDDTIQTISKKATALRLKLEDRTNRTAKERSRTEEELKLQKRFLEQHLSETIHANQMNMEFYENKLNALRNVMVHCIDREVASLIQHGEDFKRSKISNLLDEKKLIERELDFLKEKMQYLPQKWQKSEDLSLKKKLALQVMKTMTELIENKTLSQNLSNNSSKPFDLAIPPLSPKKNYLLFSALIFGILGGCGYFCWQLFHQALKGFPIHFEKLQMLQVPVLGTISYSCDGYSQDYISDQDLETLRQAMCFVGKKSPMIVSVIGGEGPHFGHLLSSLLSQQGIGVLLMDCYFQNKMEKKIQTGIKQCIKDLRLFKTEKLPEGYEYLSPGGTTRFGAEIIGSRQFSRLLDKIKNNYDIILLYSKTKLHFAEAKNFLPLIDKCIISLIDEDTNDVYNFVEYVKMHTNVELSFMMVKQ